MKIIISNLSEGKHLYTFLETTTTLGLEGYSTLSDIKVNVEIQKYGGQIQARISFKSDFVFECDRCTKEIPIGIKNSFEVVYKYSKKYDEDDSRDDNIFFISPETNSINIRDLVREYILLSIPMKKIPAEENGLCLGCNLKIEEILTPRRKKEINPVWEKLIKIKSKNA